MPACRSWLKEKALELGTSTDDHTVAVVLNMPAIGVLSAIRMSFTLSMVANIMSDFPLNGVALLVFPNRGSHDNRLACNGV